MTRLIAFLYGLLAYLLFFCVILYAIGFVSGVVVPKTIDDGAVAPTGNAVIIDLLLMAAFAIQHSVMARQGFKRWWTRLVPRTIERSTYVWISSLLLALLCWQWRPMPQVVWQVADPPLAKLVLGLSFAGWTLLFTSTFLINHFELFGLHQVTNNLSGKALPEPRLHTPLYYRFVRHPLYLGFVIAFWSAPTMTLGHLMFAAVCTGYIFVGIMLEERDLIELFGDEYRHYKRRVPMLLPWRKPI